MAQVFNIAKLDDEQMLAFGYASVAVKADGSEVVDSQGDTIPPSVLEEAAYDFVLNSRSGAVMHEPGPVARLVESFLITPDKLQKMGLPPDSMPQGWWVGFKIDNPAVWKRVRSGELRAFSIGGSAVSEAMNG